MYKHSPLYPCKGAVFGTDACAFLSFFKEPAKTAKNDNFTLSSGL
jgi:hypothetical protein